MLSKKHQIPDSLIRKKPKPCLLKPKQPKVFLNDRVATETGSETLSGFPRAHGKASGRAGAGV